MNNQVRSGICGSVPKSGKRNATYIELTDYGIHRFSLALADLLPESEIEQYLKTKANLSNALYEAWIAEFSSRITFQEQHGGSLVMSNGDPKLDEDNEALFLIWRGQQS